MHIKRLFDIFVATLSIVSFALPMLFIAIAIKSTSRGPVLYWSKRVGKNNALFSMPKFRTMRINTPVVATHLLSDPSRHLTPIGNFLRKASLDELPQLWCILNGDMTLVGPRPALFNQEDLIAARTAMGVDALTPGLTGWAQVNGRDELSIPDKVAYDFEYLQRRGFFFDLHIMFLTAIRVVHSKGVSH